MAHKVVDVRGVFGEIVVGACWLATKERRLGCPHFLREPRLERKRAQRVCEARALCGRLGKHSAVPAEQLVNQ